MAAGFTCQFCEGKHPVTVLITWLANGASVNVCDEDLAPALINILAVDLGVDPTRFYDGVRKLVDREGKRQAAEAEKGTPDTDPDGAASGPGELTPGGDGDADLSALAALDAVDVDDASGVQL